YSGKSIAVGIFFSTVLCMQAKHTNVALTNNTDLDALILMYQEKGMTRTINLRAHTSTNTGPSFVEKISISIGQGDKKQKLDINPDMLDQHSSFSLGSICTIQFPPQCSVGLHVEK
ncbi:MAG TPA: hypothetical protein VEK38_02140, partial [Candidatus Bathyarchaeia archaeon]|nr:hypothetical protein [Candidatus Bathyarchaeia archaeon]